MHHSCCTRGGGGFTTISTFSCGQQVFRRGSYLKNRINKEAKEQKSDQRKKKGGEDMKEGKRSIEG